MCLRTGQQKALDHLKFCTCKAKYYSFCFNDLHVRHKVAIILAGIREISGKIAFEPVRGLIIIKAFEFCSLIDLNI